MTTQLLLKKNTEKFNCVFPVYFVNGSIWSQPLDRLGPEINQKFAALGGVQVFRSEMIFHRSNVRNCVIPLAISASNHRRRIIRISCQSFIFNLNDCKSVVYRKVKENWASYSSLRNTDVDTCCSRNVTISRCVFNSTSEKIFENVIDTFSGGEHTPIPSKMAL